MISQSILLSCLTLIIFLPINSKSQFLNNICENSTNYATNSTFQTNLNLLLTSLTLNTQMSGFYNSTIGKAPDLVYGLALCRGDISTSDCTSCLAMASQDLPQFCPYNRGAIAWYDKCLVRYSNKYFFSNLDTHGYVRYMPQNGSNPYQLEQEFSQMMGSISQISVLSNRFFATGVVNVTGLDPAYGLVQCTRDLNRDQCIECLTVATKALKDCCFGNMLKISLKASCIMWYEDEKFFSSDPIWVAPSPRQNPPVDQLWPHPTAITKGNENKKVPIALGTSLSLVVLSILAISMFIFLKRRKGPRNRFNGENILENVKNKKSLLFEFSALQKATNNFSDSNILGAGGFGPVYKGKLLDGKEIAVKRLARGSDQGLSELTNEVQFLAELQHKNLVKLFGVCLEKNEMLLVYEYIRNKSLDKLLFDDTSGIRSLNWEERLKIIQGISRGLLYLHQDSAIRLIHRDLKAGNILIDQNMNPKISDFGLARLLGGDHTQSKTTKVVGTYGYMAPEYAIHGTVSTKVDIFSFGVLILEIIAGKRSSSFSDSNVGSLINYAWGNWRNGTAPDLIDPSLGSESSTNLEAIRCINIGLLCVQENPNERPDINLVNLMLTRQRMQIPQPSRPAFVFGDYNLEDNSHASSSISSANLSVNYVSCTEVYPR